MNINIHCIFRQTENADDQVLMQRLHAEAKQSWPRIDGVNFTEIQENKNEGFLKQRMDAIVFNNADYVGAVDDDDILDPLTAESFFNFIKEHKPKLIQSGRSIIDITGKIEIPFRETIQKYSLSTVLNRQAFMHHLIIARKDVAVQAAYAAQKVVKTYPKEYHGIFDLAYNIELLRVSNCEYFSEIVYKWRKYSKKQGHVSLHAPINQLFNFYQKAYLN